MRRMTLAMLALLLPTALWSQGGTAFPHAAHAKLFPTCTGCHAGVPTGDAARTFPAATQCAACHDGTVQRRVTWTPPVARLPGLLVFSHPIHTTNSKVDTPCQTCHGDGRQPATWMNVARPAPDACLTCHKATAHLADDNRCVTCHRTLAAATRLTVEQITALPKPASHSRADFISTHGPQAATPAANCATCHARESCQRCHPNASRSVPITALATDARVARVVDGKQPSYPLPADHRRAQFAASHGALARASIERCAACHARASCATCHAGDNAPAVLDQLPTAAEAAGKGVQLQRSAPGQGDAALHRVSVHPSNFAAGHGTVAAAGGMNCTLCHSQQRFCGDCHAGERNTRRYHPVNFVSRHAPESYSRDTECSSCHSTEAFCRACHIEVGRAAKVGNRNLGYHNAQPRWFLQHGTAARQQLSSCVSCHQQSYCMQCHSNVGMRISPHGPDFDAARMSKRNPQLCLQCHYKNPLAGK